VNATDNPGDYLFNVHAAGLDVLAVTHDFALTLQVIDLTLSTPSPASVSVAPGNTTTSISLLVSALGAFNATVTLSCSSLPTGAACQFQPAASVVPSGASPAAITLNISSTTSSTALGTSQVIISASTPGKSAKSQTLTLTVGVAPDYSITISNPTLVGSVNLIYF